MYLINAREIVPGVTEMDCRVEPRLVQERVFPGSDTGIRSLWTVDSVDFTTVQVNPKAGLRKRPPVIVRRHDPI